MNMMLHIDSTVLGRLDAVAATSVFRSLLWCEARRVGLSPHKVVISLRTNVSDGGIDAKVQGNADADSILTKGTSFFQVKAGDAFKPWRRSSLIKELFGNAKVTPAREKLSSGIRDCFDNEGQYIIVSFGHDLTPPQHSNAKKILNDLLSACGYKSPKVEVLGQGQLIGLMSFYPSLALTILGRGILSFLTLESWKLKDDMLPTLQLAEPQIKFITKIRGTLRRSICQHVRVIGEPGIGKTRLVLEALSSEDLAPTVVYVPHADDFQQSQLFNELIREDQIYHIVLVIDECTEKQRASIWGALKGKKTLQLITIDHGPETSSDREMLLLQCPRLPDSEIEAIIASYVGKQTCLSHWASWCDGSPRVAHAVGENLRSRPEDLLKSPATVPMWERFIAGYDSLDSKNAQESLTVMRHIALFTRFGFEEPVSGEAMYVSELVRAVDPSITWQRFQEIVERLRQRRILQGRRTLFIIPKALHIYLWINYWNSYGRGFNFQNFFVKVPSELRRWFLELFIYAHVSPVACDVVRNILGPTGPFSDKEFLVSEYGSRFLNYLAEADPASTLKVLEQNFGTWTSEELKQWSNGRQNIVWALEKIAVWREYFVRTAELLIKLALAENASNSNNSKGLLLSLFKIGTGWSATQATPDERFPILQKMLDANDRQRKYLGLQLVKEWLSTHGSVRLVGAEFQGLRPEIEFWRPHLWSEVLNALRSVWRYLFTGSRSWPDEERLAANNTLIEAGTPLLRYASIANEVLETFFVLADDTVTDRRILTHAIILKLKNRGQKLPKGMRPGLRKLDKKITGQSFWDRFCRYVLNTSWDEDYSVVDSQVKQLACPTKRLNSLVNEIKRQPLLFSEHLPKFLDSEGHRLVDFGFKIAQLLHSQNYVDAVTSAQFSLLPNLKTQFIGGYFAGLRECQPEIWETSVLRLLNNLDSLDIGINAVSSSGMSLQVLQRLLVLFKAKSIKPSIFSGLCRITESCGIPQSQVEEAVLCLVDSKQKEALGVAIEIADYYFFRKEQPRYCNEDVLFRLITTNTLLCRDLDNIISYHWRCVANGFRERFPERDIDLFSAIMSNPDCLLGSRGHSGFIEIADKIAKAHPDETWTIVCKKIETDGFDYSLICWLGDDIGFNEDLETGAICYFNPYTVMSWVKDEPQTRAYELLLCLPKTLNENEGGVLTRLFLMEFGDDEDLTQSLITHFWTGGFCGSESACYSRKRDKAREWISTTKPGKILSWLYRYTDFLSRRIEEAELDEERRF